MYVCDMENARIAVYTHLEDIPAIEDRLFFHGKELFGILSSTPGCTPYMFVGTDSEGHWLGHLLATLNRRGRLLPPYLYTTGNVLGEGCYRDEATRDALFPELIHAVTRHFTRRLCLVIEFSQLSKKMLGYRHFRRNGYVPVPFKHFESVTFYLGYAKDRPSMTFEIQDMTYDEGYPQWGAEPGKKYFIIKLGKRLI